MEEGDKSKWGWGGKTDLDLEKVQEMNIQTWSKLRDEDLEEFLSAKKRTNLSTNLKRHLGLSATCKAVKGKSRRKLESFGFTHLNYFKGE